MTEKLGGPPVQPASAGEGPVNEGLIRVGEACDFLGLSRAVVDLAARSLRGGRRSLERRDESDGLDVRPREDLR